MCTLFFKTMQLKLLKTTQLEQDVIHMFSIAGFLNGLMVVFCYKWCLSFGETSLKANGRSSKFNALLSK